MPDLVFQKLIALDSLPSDWELVNIAVDWSGLPLLLMIEGRGPEPAKGSDSETWSRWFNTKPKALHTVDFRSDKIRTTCIQRGGEIHGGPVQPFKDGWIAGIRWGDGVRCYDSAGALKELLDLGKGIAYVQTEPSGRIWVSYYDEGVYGSGISTEGLVCFDGAGTPVFRYQEFAEQNELPHIDDCYAMNVSAAGDVWVNYYSDFPLVCLENMHLKRHWLEFGSLGSTFAVRDDGVHYLRKSRLMFRLLDAGSDPEPVNCFDENGDEFVPRSDRYVSGAMRGAPGAARGPHLIIDSGSAIYAAVT